MDNFGSWYLVGDTHTPQRTVDKERVVGVIWGQNWCHKKGRD